VKSLRPDKVKRHIEKFDDGFVDVVVGMTMLVLSKSDTSVVGVAVDLVTPDKSEKEKPKGK